MLPLNVQGANNFRIIFPDAELMGVMALDVSAALPRRDSFAYRRPGPGSCERWGWGAWKCQRTFAPWVTCSIWNIKSRARDCYVQHLFRRRRISGKNPDPPPLIAVTNTNTYSDPSNPFLANCTFERSSSWNLFVLSTLNVRGCHLFTRGFCICNKHVVGLLRSTLKSS